MRFVSEAFLVSTVAALLVVAGCKADLKLRTREIARDGAAQEVSVATRTPLAVGQGEVLTLTGTGFSNSLTAKVGDTPVTDFSVVDSTKVTMKLPQGTPYGFQELTLTNGGEPQVVSIFFRGNLLDHPLLTVPPDEVCAGTAFYDAAGALQTGSKDCGSAASACTASGQTGCLTTTTVKSIAVADVLAANLKENTSLLGISGTVIPESHDDCSADGESGCVSSAEFPAVDATSLAASNIAKNAQIGGVVGTKADVKLCMSGKGYTRVGGNGAPWDGAVTLVGSYSGLGFTVTGDNSVDFTNLFSVGSTMDINGTSATVTAVTDANNLDVDLAVNGALTITYVVANDDLSVDDYQNGESPPYSASGATNCGPSNMADVTSSAAPLKPDAAAVATWTKIYQDALTGLYFTNEMGTSTSTAWATALANCDALNGTTGGNGWRLPTQKELLQLYVDGIAGIGGSFGNTFDTYWSSTTRSFDLVNFYAWSVNLGNGGASTASKDTLLTYLCVRQ